MKKFVVMETIERNIQTPVFFDTYEDAEKEVKSRVEDELCEGYEQDDNLWWGEIYGWNYDYAIMEVEI